MKTANIVSNMLNQSSANQPSKSSLVSGDENSFNAHFNREMNSANPIQKTGQNNENNKVASNEINAGNDMQTIESKPATNANTQQNTNDAATISKGDQTSKKAVANDKEANKIVDKHESDNPLMLLFGVMASVPNPVTPNIVTSNDAKNSTTITTTAGINTNIAGDTKSDAIISQAIAQFTNQTKGSTATGGDSADAPVNQVTQNSGIDAHALASLKTNQTTDDANSALTEANNGDFAKTLSTASKSNASTAANKDLTANSNATQAAPTVKGSMSELSQLESRVANSDQNKNLLTANLNNTQTIVPHEQIQMANIVQNVAASVAVNGGNQITQPFGSNGWDKALGQKVLWMVGESIHSAELSLNPPDLGPLQVVLKISHEHASASFTCAQPEVREALESSLPKLRQMMSDAGIQLSGFSVNTQSSGQGQQSGSYHPASHQGGNARSDVVSNDITPVLTTQARVFTSKIGEVDTFA